MPRPMSLGWKSGWPKGAISARNFFDDVKADFRVRHFASAKFQRDFDFHVFAKKINGVRQLDAEVVRINARA